MDLVTTVESFLIHRQPGCDFEGQAQQRGWLVEVFNAPQAPPEPMGWQKERDGRSVWAVMAPRPADWVHFLGRGC
eukprot:9472007-Pyramimonas_sp.AAC.1